ncbi:ABC transporter ATP-binding protein [Lacticaseibacillus manihotivorans]|uniref:Abc-type multidrug transport system, atpase and permease component n=2 Tax=Lacticaseibacillus manihotivorans TaxID=88233 RepID=A0A0R1R0X8_9LACO|nr:ABC transporter ATP-binding protein [Lacticaseibacillus manihotivorans]KRL47893.1 abc-type multidrug transport system, atpase and permease component [Lacticaseibacillus manihotivorans DSM 13343 = JCM 12514]QFQ91840.1 ATP-binding cassette domain-containing protein [Lacticaseibacillus manihotivorans]
MFAIIMHHTHGRARWAFFLAPLIMLGEVSCDLQQPTLMSQIIDTGLAHGDGQYVLHHALLMLMFAVLGLICGATCGTLGSYASLKMGESLRAEMLQIALSSRDAAGLKPATLITRITNDVTQMQNLVMMVTRGMVRAPMLLLGGIVMSTLVCPDLAPILFIIMPILVIFILIVMRRSLPLYTQMQAAVDRVNRGMRENLQGAKTIKSYVLEDHQFAEFKQANQNLQTTSLNAAMATVTLAPVIQLLLNLGVVIALSYGGSLAIHGSISDGQIIAFVNYMIQITTAMIQTANIITAFSRAITSAARVQAVLDETAPMPQASAPLPNASSIEFAHVTFGFDQSTPILNDVSFVVPDGHSLGIVGPTGAGKTTLINLLTRSFDDYSGKITIGGTDIQTLSLADVHTKVKVALQDAILFAGTIASNLSFGGAATPEALSTAAQIADANEFITPLAKQFDAPVEQRGKNFSGGQRQRLNLARAFTNDPDIVVLDDATSAVDQSTNAEIKQQLAQARQHQTTLIISQRVTNVIDCDEIIVLEAGKITARGDSQTVYQNSPFYRQLVDTQLGGGRHANE